MSKAHAAEGTEAPELLDVTCIDDLEPASNEFAANDRRWRVLNHTLERRIARIIEIMATRIDPAGEAREQTGKRLAQMALAWRSASGSAATEITLNNTHIVFYDGERGELKVLDEQSFARWLIEAGLGELVSSSARPVYEVDKAKAKAMIKADPDLLVRLASTGAARLTRNRTVKISTKPTPSEKKQGTQPAPFVYGIPEED